MSSVVSLRSWQSFVKGVLDEDADRRSIFFVVDSIGGLGKTWFSHYYPTVSEKTCVRLSSFKKLCVPDIESMKVNFDIVMFDIHLSNTYTIDYELLCDLKDGFYIHCDDLSTVVERKSPIHVVVFLNRSPDLNKMTPDRYWVVDINKMMEEECNDIDDVINQVLEYGSD